MDNTRVSEVETDCVTLGKVSACITAACALFRLLPLTFALVLLTGLGLNRRFNVLRKAYTKGWT